MIPRRQIPGVAFFVPTGTQVSIGLLLSDDLLFASRIKATATAHGLCMKVSRDVPSLLKSAKARPPACVLLDLQIAGSELRGLVSQLRSFLLAPRIIAYGSHVDTATLNAARSAGCDVVLPRSAFAERLEDELPVWFSPVS